MEKLFKKSPYRMNALEGKKIPYGESFSACSIQDAAVVQPQRRIPCLAETDVLVVGGGPAGTAAAIAAARTGVRVVLAERYGYLGGLATGGLVLTILGHWTDDNVQVCQGVGEEMMQRLEKMPNGIIRRETGINPVVDGEIFKIILNRMLQEAGVDLYLHSYALSAILEGEKVVGAVFQTKQGPRAIRAKQVIDATGDGDIFASAGAAHEERDYAVGLAYRFGGISELEKRHKLIGDPTPQTGVHWTSSYAPPEGDGNGLDATWLTHCELVHREIIWERLQKVREIPGCENASLVEVAPQLGVRVSRVLDGTKTITFDGFMHRCHYDDCIGLGGADSADHHAWEIPLGALIPKRVDNLLTAGRSTSFDTKMTDLVRLIPNCWVTGQGAGVAAACAVQQNELVRNVDFEHVRWVLLEQKACLG
ncbi:MAG: FAD-dependent oxidoreductase [Kiritimatiellia bacterium]